MRGQPATRHRGSALPPLGRALAPSGCRSRPVPRARRSRGRSGRNRPRASGRPRTCEGPPMSFGCAAARGWSTGRRRPWLERHRSPRGGRRTAARASRPRVRSAIRLVPVCSRRPCRPHRTRRRRAATSRCRRRLRGAMRRLPCVGVDADRAVRCPRAPRSDRTTLRPR